MTKGPVQIKLGIDPTIPMPRVIPVGTRVPCDRPGWSAHLVAPLEIGIVRRLFWMLAYGFTVRLYKPRITATVKLTKTGLE